MRDGQQTTTVITDLDRDERLLVSGPASFYLLWKSGRKARLKIEAKPGVLVQKTREQPPSMAD